MTGDTPLQKEYTLQNVHVNLRLIPQVFRPTIPGVTGYIGKYMRVSQGERIIDMGCGCGILAILAAKLGAAEVYAVDKQSEACELTEENARNNGVERIVKVMQGDLFEPLHDVLPVNCIIGDVAGLPYAVSEPWYYKTVPRSGVRGSELPVEMIRQAPAHLVSDGRIYIPTGTLTDQESVEREVRETFGEVRELVIDNRRDSKVAYFQLHPKLYETFDEWKLLFEEGIIKLYQFRNGIYERLQAFDRDIRRIFYQFRLLEAVKRV